MKAAMSDDSGDSIEEQIQAHYQKFQQEPCDPRHALAIASLYEKRREYANAVPWFEAAFDLGGRVDASLERRVFEMKVGVLKQQIAELQQELEAEDDPEDQAGFKARIDGLLEELNGLLVLQKKQEQDQRKNVCDWSGIPYTAVERRKPDPGQRK
jgi:hypothetical protein